MGISTLFKDPQAFQANAAAFAGLEKPSDEAFAYLSYADGLMAAVIVSPEFVSPSEWLPLIVNLSAEGGDIEEAQLATNLTLLQYNKILDALSAGEEVYEPFFWEGRGGRIVTRDWAEGFFAGMRLRSDAWKPIVESDDRVLGTILYVLLQKDEFYAELTEKGEDPEEIFDSARKEVSGVVCDLYDRWADARLGDPHRLTRRVPKIGRNDPCPCGSGKKYKKCCLN